MGYETSMGEMVVATAEAALASDFAADLRGKVQLIFTSPPFPLNTKKRYGNLQGEDYVRWLAGLAPKLTELLTPDGSIAIELGNAWEPGRPVMSTLALRALLAFQEAGDLNLCQSFVCQNPARLPSPAQWVTIERIRVKDSFTHVWWLSPADRPKADNRRVLTAYGPRMQETSGVGGLQFRSAAVGAQHFGHGLQPGQRRRYPRERPLVREHLVGRQVFALLPRAQPPTASGEDAAGSRGLLHPPPDRAERPRPRPVCREQHDGSGG